ncbi:MAG: autotransporter-associated beta strand repeat-containing protein, partial [Verrucomicrobiia bacterium]
MTTLLWAAALAVSHAQSTFTNTASGLWSAAGSWAAGSIPLAGGSSNYIIIFNNAATDWSTNNRASGNSFLLNQLVFNGAGAVNITNGSATNLVFWADSLGALPALNQNNNLTNTIYSDITLNNALTIGGSGSSAGLLTLRGAVAGSGSLTMTGAFTVLLNASNTYTGGTIINDGIVRLGAYNALGLPGGSTVATVNSGGSLDLNGFSLVTNYNSKTLFIAGFGSGGFGSDSGAVYSAGASIINSGLANVTLSGDAAIGGGGGRMDITGVLNGGGFALYKVGGNETWFAGSGYLTNTPSVIITNGYFGFQANSHFAGAGDTVFTVQTNGTLRTYGNLTFTNAVVINGGRVQQAGGGTVELGSIWNSPITLNGISNRFDALGGALMMGGNITGAGDLTKLGYYGLVLSGNNDYSGGTFINDGMLRFTSTNAIPTVGKIFVGSINAGVMLNSNTVVTELLPHIRGDSSGAVGLMAGSANEDLDFTSNGGYTNLSLGAASTMTYGGTYTPFQSGGINYYRLAAYSNVVFTFTNVIADGNFGGSESRLFINTINGAVNQSQAGVIVITNANSYSGQTILAATGAVLQISDGLALGNTSGGTIVSNLAQLRITGNITVNESLTLSGDGIPQYSGALNNVGGTNTWAGGITGGSIASTLGTLILSGGVTNNGLFRGRGGIIIITNTPVTFIGGAVTVADGTAVIFSVTNNNMATLTPSWNGLARLGVNDAFATNVALVIGSGGGGENGRLDLNGFNQTFSRLADGATNNFKAEVVTNTVANNAVLTIFQAANSTFRGQIGGAITLVKGGSGVLTLDGTNTYSGGTIINGGELSILSRTNLGYGFGNWTNLTFGGGVLQIRDANTITNLDAFTVNWNNFTGGIGNAAGGIFTITNNIGGGGFGKFGSGLLVLSGANTYSGGTIVGGGVLYVTNDNNLGDPSAPIVFGGGTLETTNSYDSIRPLIFTNASAVQVDGANTTNTFSGAISTGGATAGGLTKSGVGTLYLTGGSTGVVTMANAVNVTGGLLGIRDADIMVGTGVGTINGANGSNAVLQLSGNAALISSGNTALNIGNAGRGVLIVQDNALVTNKLLIGNSAGGVGAVYQRGGVVVNTGVSGNNSYFGTVAGSYGYYQLDNGTLTNVGYVRIGYVGYGMLQQYGGRLYQAGDSIDLGNSGTGVVYVAGGNFVSAVPLSIGGVYLPATSGRAEFTVAGSGVVTVSNLTYLGTRASTTNILNIIHGGQFETRQIAPTNNSAISFLNFDGGTLRAGSGASAAFVQNISGMYVYEGGATIDSGINNITISPGLQAATGYGLSGITTNGLAVSELSGYIGAPYVRITGGSGSNATAIAQIDPVSGIVTNIVVTSAGVGYGSGDTLTITLIGGGNTNVTLAGFSLATNSQSGGLTKYGGGALTSTNDNNYEGATIINAGRIWLTNKLGAISRSTNITIVAGAGLTISNTPQANNAGRLRSDAMLVMKGGDFAFGNSGSTAVYAQALGVLKVSAGASSINMMQVGTTATNTLTFASLSRDLGATIHFIGTGLGTNYQDRIAISAAPALVNGIIGPWAYVNTNDWATYNSAIGSISNYTAYASTNNTANWNSTVNALVIQGGNATLTQVRDATNYTLNVRATSTTANQPGYWNLAGYGATILGGGLLDSTTVANDFTIYGGTLTAGTDTAPAELIYSRFGPNSGYLRVSIVDNGPLSPLTLVKSGAGNLVLGSINNYWGSSNSYSGGTIIAAGILYMGTDGGYQESANALGSGPVTIMPGAQLRFGGSAALPFRGVDYNIANNITNNGGLIYAVAGNQHLAGIMTMVGTNSTLLANWVLNDLYLDGAVTGSAGARIMTTGNGGAVFFSNTNNYTGGTYIEGGYLYLGSTNSMGSGWLYATNQGAIGTAYAIDQDFIHQINDRAAAPVLANIGMATNSANDLDFSLLPNLTTNALLAAAPGRVVRYDGTLTPALATYRLNGGPQYGTLLMGRQLTGANNLFIGNAGIVALTNNNDYSGWTYISSGGTLQIGSNTTTGTLGGGNVTNAGTLVFARSDAYAVGNIISGGGTLAKNGSGTLLLLATNLYTGNTFVNAGTLQAGSTNPFGTATLTLNFGGTLDLNDKDPTINALAGQFGSLVTDNSAAGGVTTLKLGGGNATIYSGIIADGATTDVSVGKIGTAIQTFAGKNTYTGGTFVSNGVLRATYGIGLPTAGNLTLGGSGVLETGVGFTNSLGNGNGQIQILAGGNAGFSANNIYGYEAYTTGVVINLGGLGADLQFGSTFFNPGQFVLNAASANELLILQNGLDLNGATRFINVGASTSMLAGAIINSSGTAAQFQKEGAGWLIVNAPMNFTGAVYVNGGTLQLMNTGFYNGTVTINAGTLYLNSISNLANYSSLTFSAASTLRTTNSIILTRGITQTGNATYNIDPSSMLTVTGVISGAGQLIKAGLGTMFLDTRGPGATNAYSGVTYVNAGTLLATTTNAFGTNGINIGLGGSASIGTTNVLEQQAVAFFAAKAVRAGQAINGAIVLAGVDSDSNLNFNFQGTTNAFLGASEGTWIYSGTLTPWTNSTLGNTLFGLRTTNFLLGGGNGTLEYSSVIGTGTRTNVIIGPVGGMGTVYLSAPNIFAGTAAVVGGTLRAKDGVGLPTGANLLLTGGVFEVVSQDGGTNFSRTLGFGAGQVRVTGGNSGFSTTNGATTILMTNLGYNRIQWGSNTFNPTMLVLNTNTASDRLTLANELDLNAATRAIYVGGNTAVISGSIMDIAGNNAGNRPLVKWGTGTLLLATNNMYWGNTVNEGVLQVGAPLALGSIGLWHPDRNASARAPLVMNGGVLDLNGYNVMVESLAGNLGAVITDNIGTPGLTRLTLSLAAGAGGAVATTYSGMIQDGANGRQLALSFGQEADDRAMVMTLPYSNNYSGGTLIYGGNLFIGSTNSLGSGSLRMAAGGALGPAYALLDQSFLNWAASRSDSTNRLNGVFIMQGLGANLNTNNFDFSSSALSNAFLGVAWANNVTNLGTITPGGGAYRLGGGGGNLFIGQPLTGAYDVIIGPAGASTAPYAFGGTVYFTNANTYSGLTWVRQGAQLVLSNLAGNAITGDLRIGDGPTSAGGSAYVKLGASEQIPDTATITFQGAAGGRNPYLVLMGNNETVSGIFNTDGTAVIQNRQDEAVNTSGILTVSNNVDNFYYGYFRDYSGGLMAMGEPTLGLTKSGQGALTLAGASINFSGPLTINRGVLKLSDIGSYYGVITNKATLILDTKGQGRNFTLVRPIVGRGEVWKTGPNMVKLDFSGAGAPVSNIFNESAPMNLAGGTLWFSGAANFVATQSFEKLNLASGYSTIVASNGPLGQAMAVDLGAFTRGSGAVLQVLGTGGSYISGAPSNGPGGIIGGWALYGLNDWAANDGTGRFTNYTAYVTPNGWGATANVTVDTNSFAPSGVGGTSVVNSLRFTNSGTYVLSLTNRAVVVQSGGILFGNIAGLGNAIGGGTITSGTNEMVVMINRTVARRDGQGVIIGSQIINNGATGVTLVVNGITANDAWMASGLLLLTNNNNTFSGGIILNGGGIQIAADGALGAVPASARTNIMAMSGYAWLRNTANMTINANRGIFVNTNAVLYIQSRDVTQTVAGVVSGAGRLVAGQPSYEGRVFLTNTNTLTGLIEVNSILNAQDGVGLPTAANLVLNADGGNRGILETSGTFSRALGAGPGQFQIGGGLPSPVWAPNSGGFAAFVNPLTVNVGGDGHGLLWGESFFNIYWLNLGDANSLNATTWVNPIDLNGGQRNFYVYNTGIISGALTSGTLSGAGGSQYAGGAINKDGPGVLWLQATNSYPGVTVIWNGTLRAEEGVGMPVTSPIIMPYNGIFESSNDFTRPLITSALAAYNSGYSYGVTTGGVTITGPGASGFSAYGDDRIVNIGGDGQTLVWSNVAAPSLLLSNTWGQSLVTILGGGDTSDLRVGMAVYGNSNFQANTYITRIDNTYQFYVNATSVNYAATPSTNNFSTFNPVTFAINGLYADHTLTLVNNIDLNGSTNAGGSIRGFYVGGATGIISGTITNTGSGVANILKTGRGVLWLPATNWYNGLTVINQGTLRADEGVGIVTNRPVVMMGIENGASITVPAILELSNDFTRPLLSVVNNNGVSMGAVSGGFSARGRPVTVDLGTNLIWGALAAPNMVMVTALGSGIVTVTNTTT